MNGNNPIPLNTWAYVQSINGVLPNNTDLFAWLYFKFDGNSWILQTINWNNNHSSNLQDVCNSLSISEIDILKKEISIYPNPTNNFITIQNNRNSTENFEYKIVDLTGRTVKSGDSKFNEQINIESLSNGNYIIQIQTEYREKFTEKLIKN